VVVDADIEVTSLPFLPEPHDRDVPSRMLLQFCRVISGSESLNLLGAELPKCRLLSDVSEEGAGNGQEIVADAIMTTHDEPTQGALELMGDTEQLSASTAGGSTLKREPVSDRHQGFPLFTPKMELHLLQWEHGEDRGDPIVRPTLDAAFEILRGIGD